MTITSSYCSQGAGVARKGGEIAEGTVIILERTCPWHAAARASAEVHRLRSTR